MTALIALDGLWLNAVADPNDALQVRLQPGWQPTTTRPGEVRGYGPRRRAVASGSTWKALSLPLRMLTQAQADDLERRVGAEQWFRTSSGLRLVGIFWTFNPAMLIPETTNAGLATATLTVEQVSGIDTV